MQKILLFGNGISIKYAHDKYNYNAIKESFLFNLENIAVKTNSIWDLNNKYSYKCEINQKIKLILDAEFNEETFYKLFITITENHFKNNEDLWKKQNFEYHMQHYDFLYKTILENKQWLLKDNLMHLYKWSYYALDYSICAALSIDREKNNWIKINYEKCFIDYIKKSYAKVYTTNYYVDSIEDDVIFLHGKIEKKIKFFLDETKTYAKNKNMYGTEVCGSNILYGATYDDKVFLNSILKWIENKEWIREEPVKEDMFIIKNEPIEIDIIGLSTLGDKHIIDVIKNKVNKINIYCYSNEDYQSWKNEMDGFLYKVNFYCSHDYPGFKDKTPNSNCPKLCCNK